MKYRLLTIFAIVVLAFACRKNEQKPIAEKSVQTEVKETPEKQQVDSIEVSPAQQKIRYTVYEQNLMRKGFLDIRQLDEDIKVELGYAQPDNFIGEVVYDSIRHAFLHPQAAEKLILAKNYLQEQHLNYTFQIFDALRPNSVQHKMWEIVKDTPQEKYVANPFRGSIHNYGFAIDLTIYDMNTERSLDMGTPIDHLGVEAEYRYNQHLVDKGIITQEAKQNRELLRRVMVKAGFQPINSEWWHFNALSNKEVRTNYQLVK